MERGESGMSGGRKIRSPEDVDRFRRALIPVDEAFWASEQRFGVGRLERLISPATLAAYQRGWTLYRAALEDGDGAALESVGPKMIRALEVTLGAEAEAAGHKPLAPETWGGRPAGWTGVGGRQVAGGGQSASCVPLQGGGRAILRNHPAARPRRYRPLAARRQGVGQS